MDINYQRDHALKSILNFKGIMVLRTLFKSEETKMKEAGIGLEVHQADKGRDNRVLDNSLKLLLCGLVRVKHSSYSERTNQATKMEVRETTLESTT